MFNNIADNIIKDFNKIKDKLHKILSTTVLEECLILYNLVRQLEDHSIIVEIGTGLGRTAVTMGYGCIGKNSIVYTTDNYAESDTYSEWGMKEHNQGNWNFEQAKKNIENFEVKQYIKQYNLDSIEFSKIFKEESIDLLFIDDCHEYNFVKSEINIWKNKIKKKGIMCGHDFTVRLNEQNTVARAVLDSDIVRNGLFIKNSIWIVKRWW